MIRKLLTPFIAVVTVFSLFVGTVPAYAEGFQTTRLAPGSNLYVNGLPHAIDGSRAVFASNVQNGDIHYYDGTSLTVPIQQQDAQIGNVLLSGNHIAWLQRSTDNSPSSKMQAYVYDISTGQVQQLTNSAEDIRDLDISGDYMVWGTEDIGSANAYLHQISTNTTTQINIGAFTNVYGVDGDLVSLGNLTGGDHNRVALYAYRISTATASQVSVGDPTVIGGAHTNEGNMVWYARTNGYYQIYRYDGSQTTQITADANDHVTPRISGNYITWNTMSNPEADIYNIPSGTETTLDSLATNVYIDNDRVVWTKAEQNANRSTIKTKNLATGQTSTVMASTLPFSNLMNVNDTMVIWHGLDANSAEGIYVAKFGFPDPDTSAPEAGTPVWSANPKAIHTSSTLTVPVTDNVGVTGGEYFLGDNDPGQGNGAPMGISGNSLTANFGTDYPTGVYKVTVRAADAAGNWSQPVTDYLVVYDPDGPRMTGRRTITPSADNGDILPGLTPVGPPQLLQAQATATQPDTATFGFSIRYKADGTINNNSDLQFTYKTGTHCKNPAQAQNCHTTDLNATHIDWLITQDQNDSTGIFQGTAQLVVDGSASTVTFRITGRDGARLNSTATDQFELRIFNQGDNPNTATPLYLVNTTNIARGNIRIL